MSNRGAKVLTALLFGSVSWYAGIQFWKPLVIEQLKKDNNIRADIDPALLEVEPEPSMEDIRMNVKKFLRPDTDQSSGKSTFSSSRLSFGSEIQPNATGCTTTGTASTESSSFTSSTK